MKNQDLVRDLRSEIYDTNFKIMDIVKFETEQIEKKNNEAKRTAVTEEQKQKVEKVLYLSEEVMRSLKSFQDLNNMLYERTARFMYENSITYYINYFK